MSLEDNHPRKFSDEALDNYCENVLKEAGNYEALSEVIVNLCKWMLREGYNLAHKPLTLSEEFDKLAEEIEEEDSEQDAWVYFSSKAYVGTREEWVERAFREGFRAARLVLKKGLLK